MTPVPRYLTQLYRILSECFRVAEEETRKEIPSLLGTCSENDISTYFRRWLAVQLNTRSNNREFAEAFASGLQREFLTKEIKHGNGESQKISNGLRARVEWHTSFFSLSQHTVQFEGKVSGGDFGVVVSAPKINLWRQKSLQFQASRRGMLLQAKLRRPNGKWPEMEDHQAGLLADRTGYLGLMLYKYDSDPIDKLNPFEFQSCRGIEIEEVRKWLANGAFPMTQQFQSSVTSLGQGAIGTSDEDIIDKFIMREVPGVLHIVIDWPDDKKEPAAQVIAELRQQKARAEQKTQVNINRRK